MNKLTNKKKWNEMDFRDKLLYLWDRIEYYDETGNIKMKRLHIFYLENVLGVQYNA
jgi:hypothetical protein